jgi:hypothetical protein
MKNLHFLKDFVSGSRQPREGRKPWYNPDGDCIIYQTTDDEAIVADRIDASFTIYRSAESGKIVGCQINGVGKSMHESAAE